MYQLQKKSCRDCSTDVMSSVTTKINSNSLLKGLNGVVVDRLSALPNDRVDIQLFPSIGDFYVRLLILIDFFDLELSS